MKHLFLILVLAVVLYVVWAVSDKKSRKDSVAFLMRHGVRLGLLVLVVLLLVAAAVYLPATSLL